PERVSLGVEKIPLPAHARNRKFRQSDFTASTQNLCSRRLEVRALHGAHEGVRALLGRRCGCRALQQPATRAVRLYAPILNRQSLSAAEAPAKDSAVEFSRASEIVCLNLEIGRCVHRRNSSALRLLS